MTLIVIYQWVERPIIFIFTPCLIKNKTIPEVSNRKMFYFITRIPKVKINYFLNIFKLYWY